MGASREDDDAGVGLGDCEGGAFKEVGGGVEIAIGAMMILCEGMKG